jgi:NAD+ kinase
MDCLENKGLDVILDPKLAKRISKSESAVPLDRMKADLIITIGGDGTILRTCLELPKPEPPILAINMGMRGFLAEIYPKEALEAVEKTVEGKYRLESTMKLASFLGDTRLPDALNEVSVTSVAPAKILYMRLWKNNTIVAECQSDGAVIATQVGSTGYSLSAGGPVIDPDVRAFVFTPIAPLTVLHPIVFSTDSTVNVELLKPKCATIVIDGRYQVKATPKNSKITVTKSENESSFVRFKEDFYHRLKARLLFSRGRP